jgi:hypothetical protein
MGLLDFFGVKRYFGLDQPLTKIKHPFSGGGEYGQSAAWKYYNQQTRRPRDRASRYRNYDRMDQYELIASALDLYAEETFVYDMEHDASIWVTSENADVVRVAKQFFDRVAMEEKGTGIIRKMIKNGDHFEALTHNSETGDIIHLLAPPPINVARIEEHGKLLGFRPNIQGHKNKAASAKTKDIQWRPWEVIHFRLPSRERDNLYGDSILYPAATAWEQLKMVEDSLVVYRMTRAADRLVYYIDVGNATPEEAYDIVNRWRKSIKKREHLNKGTGDFRAQMNPASIDAELFWPVREGSQSRVEKLQGTPNISDIVDVEYQRNKLFGSLRIPRGYMGFEESQGVLSGEGTLSSQSVRFASTIKAIRKAYLSGIRRMVAIQLIYKGIDPEDPKNSFKVGMAPISYLDELMSSKIWQLRMDMVQTAMNVGLQAAEVIDQKRWLSWIFRKFLRLSDEDIQMFMGNMPDIEGTGQVTAQDADKLVQLVQSNPDNSKRLMEAYLLGKYNHQSTCETYPDNWNLNPLPPMKV